MVNNHYRWDFIGLSTDEKPTPETSEKVANGSTFYCSDTSKLYVWYKNQWYEKVIEGGGGGSSYTAGDGINISNNEISVDTDTIQSKLTASTGINISNNEISVNTTTIQPKLTAGTNITIDANNVISAEGGGGGGEPDYSTSEVDTGTKWVDGKTIYKKTFAIPSLSSDNIPINLGIANLYRVVEVKGFLYNPNNPTGGVPLVNTSTGDASNQIGVSIYSSQLHIYSKARNDWTGYATVYYTKSE